MAHINSFFARGAPSCDESPGFIYYCFICVDLILKDLHVSLQFLLMVQPSFILPSKEITKNGSAVVFSCKHGFYLTGPPVIKCSGSTWTPVNFKCFLSKSCLFSYRTMLIVEVSVSIDADSLSLSKRTALERSTIMALEYRNNSLFRHS